LGLRIKERGGFRSLIRIKMGVCQFCQRTGRPKSGKNEKSPDRIVGFTTKGSKNDKISVLKSKTGAGERTFVQ